MAEKKHALTIRLTDEELAALEKEVEAQKKKRPGLDYSKADAVRVAIAQSYIPRPRS